MSQSRLSKSSTEFNEFFNLVVALTLRSIDSSNMHTIYNRVFSYYKDSGYLNISSNNDDTKNLKVLIINIIRNEACLDVRTIDVDNILLNSAKKLIDEFLERYNEKFGQLTDKTFFDMTADATENGNKLQDLLCSLFEPTVNWGRIVGMITVMKELLLNLLQQNRLNMMADYISVCARYYDLKLRAWVIENKGLTGIMSFESGSMKIFDDILSIGKLAIVTAGALMAFRLIFNKI